MRRKLTDKLIQSLQPPKQGRLELADTLEPGLALRVTEDDRRSWAVRCWTGPKEKRVQRRITLGHPRERDGQPILTLAAAREAARDVKQAAAEGRALLPGDGLRDAQTFGQLAEHYIAAIEGERRPATMSQIARVLRHRDLAEWRDRPAVRISADDVRRLRDLVHERGPVMATRYLRVISALGTWAVSEGLLVRSPVAGIKPRAKEKQRDRILSDLEIAAFMRVGDAVGYPHGMIAKLLLLTGARLREVAHSEWHEFDFDRAIWTIPKDRSKNGKAHTLHLSAPACACLRELAEQRQRIEMLKGSSFLFTTNGRKFGLFSTLKERIDAAMAKELGAAPAHWVLHDLRRTAASTMARLKVPPHVVEKILNHRDGVISGVAAIYNQFDYRDECAEALEKLGEFVVSLAAPKVVPLRRA
jgi:integrase